jgi:hypothetical protein
MRLFSCPFHAFCKPFFSIKKKELLGRSFFKKKMFCHQGTLPSGALDYLQSVYSYYSGLSILIYLSYKNTLAQEQKPKIGLVAVARFYAYWRFKSIRRSWGPD